MQGNNISINMSSAAPAPLGSWQFCSRKADTQGWCLGLQAIDAQTFPAALEGCQRQKAPSDLGTRSQAGMLMVTGRQGQRGTMEPLGNGLGFMSPLAWPELSSRQNQP